MNERGQEQLHDPPPRVSRHPGRHLGVPRLLLVFVLMAAVVVTRGPAPTHTQPAPVAAEVNGLAVPMAMYRRLLRFIQDTPSGFAVPVHAGTMRVLLELQENQAVNQAIALTLIGHMAAQRHLTASSQEVNAALAGMVAAAGGTASFWRTAHRAGMSVSDVLTQARALALRDRLAAVLHDPGWLTALVATAQISYHVGYDAIAAIRPSIALGAPAPPFVAAALDKGQTRSMADLGGRPLILTFFTTTCGWCIADLTMLRTFARTEPDIAVVALDRGESAARVRTFLAAQHVEGLPVWLDRFGQAAHDYTVDQLPVTFFIDRHGIIRSYNFGPLNSVRSLRAQAVDALRGTNNTF